MSKSKSNKNFATGKEKQHDINVNCKSLDHLGILMSVMIKIKLIERIDKCAVATFTNKV